MSASVQLWQDHDPVSAANPLSVAASEAAVAANGTSLPLANLAAAYYQAFNAQMVGRTNAEMAADINRNGAGTNPNVRAAGA
jgi:hypothetical protein